jgi:hypothetical protein
MYITHVARGPAGRLRQNYESFLAEQSESTRPSKAGQVIGNGVIKRLRFGLNLGWITLVFGSQAPSGLNQVRPACFVDTW